LASDDALSDELADGLNRAVGSIDLLIVLHQTRGKTGGGSAVDETGALEGTAHNRQIGAGQNIGDDELHDGSFELE
jgi:hypothetical protein